MILTGFENFWHKKRVGSIDIMNVYNREVSKFSENVRLLPFWWRNQVQLNYTSVTVCEIVQNSGTEE